jgi:hypothetical protein
MKNGMRAPASTPESPLLDRLPAAKLPVVYWLLDRSVPSDSLPLRLAESAHYRARGFEVGSSRKPISRCFLPVKESADD